MCVDLWSGPGGVRWAVVRPGGALTMCLNELWSRTARAFCGVEPKLLEERFAWGGCRVRVAKEVPGLVALPVGACCGDDIEGGGVQGGVEVGEVGLRSVLERGQGLAGQLGQKGSCGRSGR
ncbi:hypothetical protein THAOC_02722, partial [Thalassiosira oceanica]